MNSIFRRNWRKKWKKRNWDCGLPDCDCGGPGCSLLVLVLLTALWHYFETPPVREGSPYIRPALRLIRSYQQHVSARRPAVCNLTPTCSQYGYDALRAEGYRGLLLTRRRLRKCRDTGRLYRGH